MTKTFSESVTRMIIKQATRSPMNRLQWLLVLSCGHEEWVTRSKRPTLGSSVTCPTCTKGKR